MAAHSTGSTRTLEAIRKELTHYGVNPKIRAHHNTN